MAVEQAFGGTDVDFAQLVKIYGDVPRGRGSDSAERKYSPPECIGAKKTPIVGEPAPEHLSTSYVERQNLTMRMSMKRLVPNPQDAPRRASNGSKAHGQADGL